VGLVSAFDGQHSLSAPLPLSRHACCPIGQSATAVDTLVILMAARTLPRIARELIAHGRSPDAPVAVTRLNSTEATAITTTLGAVTGGIELEPPVVVVVGEVAALGRRRTTASSSVAPSRESLQI
jgi:siroheme synthase